MDPRGRLRPGPISLHFSVAQAAQCLSPYQILPRATHKCIGTNTQAHARMYHAHPLTHKHTHLHIGTHKYDCTHSLVHTHMLTTPHTYMYVQAYMNHRMTQGL